MEDNGIGTKSIHESSALDIFDRWSHPQKQYIVNHLVDIWLENKADDIWMLQYHNQKFEFSNKSYKIPEEEELSKSDYNRECEKETMTFGKINQIHGISYQPPGIRDRYQISIWKFDPHGMVKVKDRYFTPKYSPGSKSNDNELEFFLNISLDYNNIVVVQDGSFKSKQAVLIFDLYDLEIKWELLIPHHDNNFESGSLYGDEYYDADYNNFYSTFPQSMFTIQMLCFNNGNTLLCPITRENMVVIYYWNVYDTQTGNISAKVERRNNDLENLLIWDFKLSPHDSSVIYYAAINRDYNHEVGTIDTKTGQVSTIFNQANYNFVGINAYLSQDWKTAYVEDIETDRQGVRSLLRLYAFEISNQEKVGLEDAKLVVTLDSTCNASTSTDNLWLTSFSPNYNHVNICHIQGTSWIK